jgi:hypothetical protein
MEMFQSQKVQVGEDTTTRRIVKVKRQANQQQMAAAAQKSYVKIPERK